MYNISLLKFNTNNNREEIKMSDKVYQIITDSILKKLDEGTIPWEKTWNFNQGLPKNGVSNKTYSGFNIFQLLCQGYSSPYWFTKKQAKEKGGTIDYEKEKSTLIIFWTFLEKKNEKTGEVEKKFPMLRYYHVYNQEQISGIKIKFEPEAKKYNNDPIVNCEQIITEWHNMPEIKWGGNPAYSPSLDIIRMKKIDQFHTAQNYYNTLFHEMAHSTMHLTRLNRQALGLSYAKEELVAEMTACFLCGMAGIEKEILDNSAAYIQNWKETIKGDSRLVIQAASMAQKACNYILGINTFTEISEENAA